MKIKVLYILLLMLTVSPKVCHAQRMDYPTLEALIADHKQIRGPIQQRAALETVNQELHDTSREKVLDYHVLKRHLIWAHNTCGKATCNDAIPWL